MRYKLRTLFLIQAFSALAIGVALWATTEYRRQRGIRIHLNSIGATWVGFQPTDPTYQVNVCFCRPISGNLDKDQEFGFVEFKLIGVTSECIEKLAPLRRVTDIRFVNCKLQDEDLDPLADIRGLTNLLFWNTPVSDNSIERIARIPGLRKVAFKTTPITAKGIERLKTARPEIEVICLP